MGHRSSIEWTDHTFNPWWGCVKVSEGCANCYAETWANRYGHDLWGTKKSRRTFSENHWKQPYKWNNAAGSVGEQHRVFCASMADVFEDNPLIADERKRLWKVINETPYLDWLLLTKRPQNMISMSPWGRSWPHNVWAMTSAENQEQSVNRIPALLKVPAAIRGLSLEPLLGPIDLSSWLKHIDWVIVGGESGRRARPMQLEWVQTIRDQCLTHNVPFFFKQWGCWVPFHSDTRTKLPGTEDIRMKRVSKKAAGRQLDGREWNELPQSKDSLLPVS